MIADLTNFFSSDATWAGVVILIILGLFLAAGAIGMIAQLLMPERYVDQKPNRKMH